MEKPNQVTDTEPRLAHYGAERSAIQFTMVGHYDLGERLVSSQNEMSALSSSDVEAGSL